MNIVYFGDGQSIHMKRWMEYFIGRGHSVHLVSDRPFAGEKVIQHDLNEIVSASGVKGVRLIRRIEKLRKFIKGLNPDIIHGHYLFPYGFWAGFSGFHPYILTAWGSDVYLDTTTMVRRMLIKRILKRAELVTAKSEDLRREVVKLGAPEERTINFTWGVDLEKFSPGRSAEVREKYHLHGPVLISSRKLSPLYNVESIIKIMPEVASEFPSARLLVLDEGESGPVLKQLASDLGMAGHIVFTGNIPYERMPEYLSAADLIISVPFSDAASMSLLEAMACGASIIASDLPSNREWISDNFNGRLVSPANKIALSEAVRSLLREPEKIRMFGQRSRELVEQKADWHKLMREMEQHYVRLAVTRYA